MGLSLLAVLATASPGAGQAVLELGEALSTASDGAYAVRIAEGEARERSAGRFEALRGILPTVRFESGLLRTTDPLAAFGFLLRQRTVTQADFAPSALVRPPVGENWAGAVVAEVPLVNPDAWLGLGAAGRATEAAEAAALWRTRETRADVVRAYFGSVLAAEKVETLKSAVEAAQAHVRQAELMVDEGVVTKSDALLARVKAGEVDAQLVSARGEARTAVRQLATLLGTPGERLVLPETLPPPESVRALLGVAAEAAVGTPEAAAGTPDRLDVRAARLGLSAARRDVARARSSWLPRINAFGRYDWHSPDHPYAGDESWTVGVMAQWTPLAGAGHLAESRAASGRREVAEAQLDAARANARLEAESAADRLTAALERLEIAERAVDHAKEAHRIVSHKYEGGLATVVELLDASATETRTRLERSHALYSVIAEGVSLRLALGGDPGTFATLDGYAHREKSE